MRSTTAHPDRDYMACVLSAQCRVAVRITTQRGTFPAPLNRAEGTFIETFGVLTVTGNCEQPERRACFERPGLDTPAKVLRLGNTSDTANFKGLSEAYLTQQFRAANRAPPLSAPCLEQPPQTLWPCWSLGAADRPERR